MNIADRSARTFIRAKLGVVFDRARSLGKVIRDVTRYAGGRLRAEFGDLDAISDPMRATLDEILLEAARRVEEAKHEVILCIAEKNRLSGALEKLAADTQEREHHGQPEHGGNRTLPGELSQDSAARRSAYQTKLEQQTKEVQRLKDALLALNDRFEDAKRARGHISARRKAERELQWMEDVARLFEHLAATERRPSKDGANEERGTK
jgi:hypothetical protein